MSTWLGFWYGVDPARLVVVRFFLGAALFIKLSSTYGIVPRLLYGKYRPGLPAHGYNERTWIMDGFHAPFIDGLPTPTLAVYSACETALLVLSVVFALGLGGKIGGRIVGVVVALGYAYLFNVTSLAFSHNELLLVFALTIVGFGMPVRFVQVLVSTIYAFTFIAKLNVGWLTGTALHDTVVRQAPSFAVLAWLEEHLPASDWCYAPATWIVLAIEAFLAVAFWLPRTRRAALVIGLLFHLGIELTMDVGAYSYAFCALYPAFFAPPRWLERWRRPCVSDRQRDARAAPISRRAALDARCAPVRAS